jgi:uncharacterized protein (DUF433 family)
LVLSLLAQSVGERELLANHPTFDSDDIRACLAYAHAVIARDRLDAVRVGGE